jgi:hypothetical protein
MELSALLLSRLQFAFTVSFQVIFPSFTIGPAAWLTVLEALRLATGRRPVRVPADAALHGRRLRGLQGQGALERRFRPAGSRW